MITERGGQLRALKGARTSLVNLEQWTDEDLAGLQHQFERLRERIVRRPHGPDSESDPTERREHRRSA